MEYRPSSRAMCELIPRSACQALFCALRHSPYEDSCNLPASGQVSEADNPYEETAALAFAGDTSFLNFRDVFRRSYVQIAPAPESRSIHPLGPSIFELRRAAHG